MIGLLLIYFVGKPFYELAHEHNKSQWGYAILGVVVYYIGTMLVGVGVGAYLAISDPSSLDNLSSGTEMMINIMAIPVGILAAWILYRTLRSRWQNAHVEEMDSNSDVLDGDFTRNA